MVQKHGDEDVNSSKSNGCNFFSDLKLSDVAVTIHKNIDKIVKIMVIL